MNILIADDNKIARETVKFHLQNTTHTIFEASDGAQTLSLYEKHDIDVILLDLKMPKISGIEIIRTIRKQQSKSYTFLIVLTVDNKDDTFHEAFEAGADDVIIKPIHASLLKYRLETGERLLQMQDWKSLIYALAQMIESRDTMTGDHIDRVQSITKIIANTLKDMGHFSMVLTPKYIEELALASTLHDIGKIAIEDEIMNKQSSLTPEEYEKMKNHPIKGYEVLTALEEKRISINFMDTVKNVVLYHHERYDGSGYPYGIDGEDIPLEAQIVGLADVYDALISARVYKPPYSFEKTRQIILDNKAKYFSPILVNAFIKAEDQIKNHAST